ncbi:MAG: hypothetical protein LBB77_02600 [Treponema sp.]|jgi:hypothetical protein|nr:hypothetical protein [Treponema sp.]
MSMPVAPASYIYSHFKHVSGTPAPDGVHGVTVNKLKILDVLIEQLSQIKRRPQMDSDAAFSMSEEQINALIEQYENQVRQARTASTVMPYSLTPSAPTGAVFNLVA